MIYTISTVLLVTLTVFILHFYSLAKIYTFKLAPFLQNDKIEWDPNIDRLKVFISALFIGLSLYFTQDLFKLDYSNEIIFYIKLTITPLLTILFFWINNKIQKRSPFEKKETDSHTKEEEEEEEEEEEVDQINYIEVSIYKNFKTFNYVDRKGETKKSTSKEKIIANPDIIKNLIIEHDSLSLFEIAKNLSILAYKLHEIGVFKMHSKNKGKIHGELINLIDLKKVKYGRANFSKYTKSYLNEDENINEKDKKNI